VKRKASPQPLPSALGQAWANLTRKITHAVRTSDGMVRFTIADWPIQGQFLAAWTPQEEKK
jgi:hypothetical protein